MKLTKIDFQVATLEDELRVDGLCRELLINFYNARLADGLSEHEATLLANSADYYLRDYLVGGQQLNLLDQDRGIVRKFAGNWYIVNTLEPSVEEISSHLQGIRSFYLYLLDAGVIDAAYFSDIEIDCDDIGYYRKRIDDFWNITGDGYVDWEAECSLK